MVDIYKNIDDHNPNKGQKILITFDDMIAGNKNLNRKVTELFIRGRKLNISIVFIMQTYFAVPKDIRLNWTHCFIMEIQNEQELKTKCIPKFIRYSLSRLY